MGTRLEGETKQQALEARFDQLAAITPEVDPCCTYAPWALSAYEAFTPDAPRLIYDGDAGMILLTRQEISHQRWILVPFEANWRLGASLVGPEPEPLLEVIDELLTAYRGLGLLGCLLSGFPREGLWAERLKRRVDQRALTGFLEVKGRHLASLDGGVDGFLGRRSAKFRAELRRGWRRMEAEGIRAEYHQAPLGDYALSQLFTRCLAVEAQSWKGQSEQGIDQPPSYDFYRRLLQRVNRRGALRLVLLSRDGEDLAYAFGAVVGARFRGYQVSQREEVARLMLGNLAQYALIQRLCEEGVEIYDLGMEMPYKYRWAEELSLTCDWFLS